MKKNSTQNNNQENNSQGFVLLFTIVVTAIIFFIGAGTYSIAIKELVISELTQNSQKSIFAADAGVECGIYARNAVFQGMNKVNCLGQGVPLTVSALRASFTLGFDNDTCVVVTIDNDTTGNEYVVFGQGYNKCTKDSNGNWEPVEYSGLTERVYKVPVPK